MASKRDIYNADGSVTTIHNGSLVVNPGGSFLDGTNGCYDVDTSYNDETIPNIATISGKYGVDGSGRFDDPRYYTSSSGT